MLYVTWLQYSCILSASVFQRFKKNDISLLKLSIPDLSPTAWLTVSFFFSSRKTYNETLSKEGALPLYKEIVPTEIPGLAKGVRHPVVTHHVLIVLIKRFPRKFLSEHLPFRAVRRPNHSPAPMDLAKPTKTVACRLCKAPGAIAACRQTEFLLKVRTIPGTAGLPSGSGRPSPIPQNTSATPASTPRGRSSAILILVLTNKSTTIPYPTVSTLFIRYVS